MRWDQLFDEIEAGSADDALLERDALVAELRDEEWGRTSWRDLLVGEVELEVQGVGRLAGEVGHVTPELLQVTAAGRLHLVASAAVLAATTSGVRAEEAGAVARRLGWPHVLRRLRDEGEDVQVVRRDGVAVRGEVAAVAADAVLLRLGLRTTAVPFSTLAVVSVPL